MNLSDYINLTWVWWTVTLLYAAVILSTVVVVVSENRNPVKSLAWVTVLLVVPGLGLVLYIVFGRNIQSKRIISRRNRRRLRRMGADTRGRIRLSTLGSSRPASQLAHLAYSLCGAELYEGCDARVFDNGTDKFEALLADIRAARSYINLEYYIIADDKIGTALARALQERARAGVKVRVIYDHVGSFKARNAFFKAMRAAGVEAYPFFKVVFPFLGTRINWRNHRKIVVIDGHTGYIGGMNVADRYITGGNYPTWRDLHLRIQGPAVASLQQLFAIDWNFMGNPLPEEPVEARPLQIPSPMGMQLIAGGPTSRWMNMTLIFQKAISNARKCVWLQTPYFLPSEGLLHALQMCALARLDVRLMLPRRSDSDMLRWASFSYISECLRAGVKVYLYEPGMLHSKAIIIDDDLATVGSCNFDFRSFEHNFEANMLVYSRSFNRRLKDIFLRDQADSLRVQPATWHSRPLLERGMESFMRLFAPIL